jgi:hypothetical protein
MFGALGNVEREMAALAAAFDPAGVPADRVVAVFEQLDRIERGAAAIKTLLARRVDEVRAWERAGFKSAAEFVAAKTGATVSTARSVLATSEKVAGLPVVEDALRSGRLSATQAVVVTDAADAAPAQQSRRVEQAQRSSMAELKTECLRTKAGVDPDREATAQRIHAARSLRTYVDGEGAWNLVARGTVADGARIEARLRSAVDDEFHQARRHGRRESLDAYTFDAFTRLLTEPAADNGTQPTLRNLMLLRVDLEALTRGTVADNETCEIAGIGPIPISTARTMLGDSILKLVITRGVDVVNVTHLGRGPTIAQQVALLYRQPMCTVEGCCRTRVEFDHVINWSDTHHTVLGELEPLCNHHHDKKTLEGWMLINGTGKRPMVPPTDPRHPKHKPPP